MSDLKPLLVAWDESYREFGIAFEGIPHDDLWKRAHPRLLSVGELAGHVAYWQAVWTLGGGDGRPDLATLPIQSPLLNLAFRYYSTTVDTATSLDLGPSEVLTEVMRIHEAGKVAAAGKAMDEPYDGQWGTWGNLVQYQVFHVAYHTGQAYSVRHLLGHETEDN